MRRRSKNTASITAGGLCAALCVVIIYMSRLLPQLELSMMAASGILVYVLSLSWDRLTAFLCYACACVLSFLILPLGEGQILFTFLFGIYPVIKDSLPGGKALNYILKLVIFNLLFLSALKLTELLIYNGPIELPYHVLIVIVLSNAMFALYDFVLGYVGNYLYDRLKLVKKN